MDMILAADAKMLFGKLDTYRQRIEIIDLLLNQF